MTARLATTRLASSLQVLKYTNRARHAHGQFCKCHTGPNLEETFRSYLRNELGIANIVDAEYTSIHKFVVDQSFPYVPRPNEEEHVVDFFKLRQDARAENPPGEDKKFNPIVAVCGSPGIGKSTFLVNFPLSTAYTNYCSASKVIVAPFTFNSGMSLSLKSNSVVGLRVLYGAAWCMHKCTLKAQSWEHFLKCFEKFAHITALEAVRLLKTVYKSDKVLLLVDEISKAPDDTAAIQDLAYVIISEADVDVLMTSLSTQYIESLVFSSNHPIYYVILPTIQDSKLGKEECQIWADAVVKKFNITDDFFINLLRSTYLLASGHPRSIEDVVKMGFKKSVNDRCWSRTNKILTKSGTSIPLLLQAINSDVMGMITKNVWTLNIASDEALDIVLSTDPVHVASHAKFRSLLEDGAIFAVPAGDKDYLASIRLSQFLTLLWSLIAQYSTQINSDPTQAHDRASALKLLGSDMIFKYNSSISSWWEACIILTIYCRSVECHDKVMTLGISMNFQFPNSMKLRIVKDKNHLKIKSFRFIENEIVVPPSGQSDYDVRVTYCCDEGILFVYGQMKISPSKSVDSPVKIRAESVVNTLINHLKSLPAWYLKKDDIDTILKQVIIIFYEWCDARDKEFQEDVLNQVRDIITRVSFDEIYRKYIDHFISHYGFTNIHYCGKKQLDGWLIPCVNVFPRLVEAVNKS